MKVVFASNDNERDLFTVKAIHDICRLEDTTLQPYFSDLQTSDQTWFRNYHTSNDTQDPLYCRSISLPSFIQIIFNRTSCYDITAGDVKTTKNLLEMCYPLYKNGGLKNVQNGAILGEITRRNRVSDQNNEFGFSVEDCYRDDVVYNMFQYTLDSDYIKNDTGKDGTSEKLRMSFLVTHTLQHMPLFEYFNDVFTETLEVGSIKVVGFFRTLGRKVAIFSPFLKGDLWLGGVAITSVLCIMLAYMRSVILVLATIVNIVFAYTIAYFVYRVVLGIDYFPFINLFSGIMIIGKYLFN